MIKLILVDDHIVIRESLKMLLEFDGTRQVVARASSVEECSFIMDAGIDADIMLIDISLSDHAGLDFLSRFKYYHSKIKVIILTSDRQIDHLIRAIDLGVDGYLINDCTVDELFSAIQSVCSGKEYIQPSLIPALNSSLIKRDYEKEKIESLTKRELEVLIKVAHGHINRDIANELKISERTVKNHIASIFKKIDVEDRTQAAVFAIKNSLIKI